VTGWLVPSARQKIPVRPGQYLPPQKVSLAENRFLQACKGAENTKEKSRQCSTYSEGGTFAPYMNTLATKEEGNALNPKPFTTNEEGPLNEEGLALFQHPQNARSMHGCFSVQCMRIQIKVLLSQISQNFRCQKNE
jgi:hypothetical protein